MAYQLWLADAARATGLPVVEVEGWQTRGSETFTPAGLVWHHTAWPMTNSDMPSLSLLLSGREDVPGPLANYGLGRSGTVYVIAAGRANHAGEGGWQGLVGNSSVLGIEAEHPGTSGTPWTDVQLDAYVKLSAELAKRGGFAVDMVCGHKEWAPTRKVDPIDLDMNDMRRRVAAAMEDDMEPVPQPDWLDSAVIDRLLAAGVLKSRPTLEPLVVWRMYVFQDRTLTAANEYADGRAGADDVLRTAYNAHRHLGAGVRSGDKV
jgi:hypothetical protein